MANDSTGYGTPPQGQFTLDPGYIPRLFQIESGGNPYAVTGSNRGLGQFGPQEEAQYGITDANRADPDAQAQAVTQEAMRHAQVLGKVLGRPPTAGELYLAHQQGIAGGPALLSADPSQPAWQAIRPFYRSDAIAQKAISGNIPSDNPLSRADVGSVTAGDFRNLWINKFEHGMGAAAPTMMAGQGAPAQAQSPPLAMSLSPGAGQSASAPGTPGFDPQQATAALLARQQQARPEGLDAIEAPAPAMPPVNLARLRNLMGMQQANAQPLPPSVAQRLMQLMGRAS